MRLRLLWIPLVALTAACSPSDRYPSSPSAVATGARVQAIATNAPGGVPVDVVTQPGASDPSGAPSVRIESALPTGGAHIDFDWGHNGTARFIEFTLQRRDDNRPALVLKPNEHTNGAGVVSHHLEQAFEVGIYDGSAAYVYPDGNRSSAYRFQLNHGVASLNGPPEPACWMQSDLPRTARELTLPTCPEAGL